MKILVTGDGGQLGSDVIKNGLRNRMDMYGIRHQNYLDITKEVEVKNFVNELKPDAIIHCAAYTAVDEAEDNRDLCWDVNVNGTKYLASVAKEIDAKFIYISTDYVFDGSGDTPFEETDDVNPIGFYGLTKLEGEKIVKEQLEKWFIVRISWVFGLNGGNFVKTMIRLSETHSHLNVVGDQYGSPTYTVDLSKLLIEMIQTERYGVYHASNEGFCSWADFAKEIFERSNKKVEVNSISSEEYPTKAARPKNSRMSKNKLEQEGFSRLPCWKEALNHYLQQLKEVN